MVKNVNWVSIVMEKKNSSSSARVMPAIVAMLFIVSYVIVWVYSAASSSLFSLFGSLPIINLFASPPSIQQSLLYLVSPVFGFFFAFVSAGWVVKKFPDIKNLRLAFPAIFIIFALFSFFIGLYWYNLPAVQPNTGVDELAVCFAEDQCNEIFAAGQAASPAKTILTINFPQRFSNSSFSLFTVAGLLGWASNFLLFVLARKNIL